MQAISEHLPIGIFDSGVGGLTVMKEIIGLMPGEKLLYLGDTARVPYGIRSSETVIRYSIDNARFLVSKGIKILVVACNTSSAVSLDILRREFSIPVIGVVEPGARAAARKTKVKNVAVIGTEATIRSGAYERAIKSEDDSIKVTGLACPLFVPLIEEGWLEGDVVMLTAEKYLSSLRYNGADSLVLGCTHYPLIKDVLESVVHIPLVDSAIETAKEVRRVLISDNILQSNRLDRSNEFFVTDSPEKFSRVGERFLGHRIENIRKVKF